MQICPKCGKELNEEDVFKGSCPHCFYVFPTEFIKSLTASLLQSKKEEDIRKGEFSQVKVEKKWEYDVTVIQVLTKPTPNGILKQIEGKGDAGWELVGVAMAREAGMGTLGALDIILFWKREKK